MVEDGVVGFLVPPRDTEGLACVLERLARDWRLRCSLGAEARCKALREFDQDINAQALADCFPSQNLS